MKVISKELNKCGVYMLINLINGKRYIGSSKNIQQRLWQHRSCLRHNHHINEYLQKAWNKYGEKHFDYSILEYCTEEDRFIREQYYVDTLKPEYNISIEVVELPDTSELTRKKLSETRKKRIQEGLIEKTGCKPVYIYDLVSNFVGEFESGAEARRILGITKSGMNKVLAGTQKQTHGYRIFHEPQTNLDSYKKSYIRKRLKKVIVYNDCELYEFNSAVECASYFKVHLVYIRDAIKSNRKFKRKYMIKYKSA